MKCSPRESRLSLRMRIVHSNQIWLGITVWYLMNLKQAGLTISIKGRKSLLKVKKTSTAKVVRMKNVHSNLKLMYVRNSWLRQIKKGGMRLKRKE